MNKLCNMYSI